MKKVFALVLSLMMILCSVSALATEVTKEADTIVNANDGKAFDTNIKVHGDNTIRYRDAAANDISGEAATELWLQVEASGQIDVTVPLVLVFQTNIDGGKATSPNTYKITNHSSADLVVTQIKVTDVVETEDKDQPKMEKVEWSDTAELTENQYMAKLTVGEHVTLGAEQHGEYDLDGTYTGERHKGGIFELAKAGKNDYEKGTDTPIALSMKTGRLSFITSRTEKTPKDDKSQLNDEMDTTKGIQLMTITYTVAIDTSDAYGEVITTNANVADKDNLLDGVRDGDTTEHLKIQENTKSYATKDGADQ